MKKLFFILLLPVFLFVTGCSKEPINPDPDPDPDPTYKITWNVSTEFDGDLSPFDTHDFSMGVSVWDDIHETFKFFGDGHELNGSFSVTLTGDSAKVFLEHDSLQVSYGVRLCGFNGAYNECHITSIRGPNHSGFMMPVKKENDWHFVFFINE